MTFRAYIVDDSTTVRDNLIETLKELADIEPVGTTDSEHEARRWLGTNGWDLAIIDLFLRERQRHERAGGLPPAQAAAEGGGAGATIPRATCAGVAGSSATDAVFDKSTELEALVDYCAVHRRQIDAAPVAAGVTVPPGAAATALPASPA